MNTSIRLTETELQEYINKEARKIVNEMKYNALYEMVKKCVDETLYGDEENFLVQHPVEVSAEGVFDFEPDEMNVNAFDKWNKDEDYWNDFDKAQNDQFESVIRESVRQLIKETFEKE